jgi:hypothetical protein
MLDFNEEFFNQNFHQEHCDHFFLGKSVPNSAQKWAAQ